MSRIPLLVFAAERELDPLELLKCLARTAHLDERFTFDAELTPTIETWLGLNPLPDEEDEVALAEAEAQSSMQINHLLVGLTTILKRLKRGHFIGGKHTSIKHFSTGVPTHLKGTMDECLERLLAMDILMKKKTLSKDLHFSLNPRRLTEADALARGIVEDPKLRDMLGMG